MSRMRRLLYSAPTALGVLLACATARADVVRFEIVGRQTVQTAPQPYEKLTGRFYGELDPALPGNTVITDIDLAPRNTRHRVEYSATFTILKPTDMSRASDVLIYNVPNRGESGIEGAGYWADFRAAGHVLVTSGWQGDLRAAPGIEALIVPVARNRDGSSVTGAVTVRFADMAANSSTVDITRGRSLGTAMPSTLDTSGAVLTRRTSETGARTVIAPAAWRFADCRQTPFPGQPDPLRVCLNEGFDPSYLYELTYEAKDPPIHGIGFAATRDLLSFLRRVSPPNPLGALVRRVIAQGTSQSGTFLRSFVNLGFNQDERGAQVLDGMNPNLAARQLAINVRFAAPGGGAGMFEPGSDGVVWWEEAVDDAHGGAKAGLLTRCRATHTCPRIVETFGASEFYSHRASPALVGMGASRDITIPPNVRRYYMPSVRHGGGPGGFKSEGVRDRCCVLPINDNPSSEVNRALMKALVEWVTGDVEPPPSRYPQLAHGELSLPTQRAMGFPVIPGQPLPDSVINPLYDYDFGAGYRRADASGLLTLQPPVVRGVLPMLVPRVDADGNETSGIRSALLQAPLGTYTGWNPVAAGFFKGHVQINSGGYIPFARTRKERIASGDPRLSLEERYGTHEKYVMQVREAVADLLRERFLLSDDAARIIGEADASDVLR